MFEMVKFIKVLSILFLLLIVLVIGVWVYFRYFQLSYIDYQYGFVILDQRGWNSTPPREGVYYSLGTGRDVGDKIISIFGVSPISRDQPSDREKDTEQFRQACGIASSKYGKDDYSISKTALNNLEGYSCSYQGMPENIAKVYVTKQYILFNKNGKSYNYVITVSYPANNPNEKEKVDRILNSVYAI